MLWKKYVGVVVLYSDFTEETLFFNVSFVKLAAKYTVPNSVRVLNTDVKELLSIYFTRVLLCHPNTVSMQ